MLQRDQVLKAIYFALKDYTHIQALCVSGSAAFNRVDEYSDIDIRIMAEPQYYNDIFYRIETSLKKLDHIQDRYIVPDVCLNGYVQRFYKLKNLSSFNIIDLVIFQEDRLFEFLDRNRHGNPIILLDYKNKLIPEETSQEVLDKFSLRINHLKEEFRFLSRILVERAILRNRFAEAVSLYHARVLAPLLEILRAKYSPSRQDFGARYLQWDLPQDKCKIIDELYAIASFEDLKINLDRAEKLFWKTANLLEI